VKSFLFTFILASLLPLTLLAQANDEDEIANLEFKANANQALLELQQTPIPELSTETLESLKELLALTKISPENWLVLHDTRLQPALALRALLREKGDTELADIVAEKYASTHSFKFKINDLNHTLPYGPAWAYRSRNASYQKCQMVAKLKSRTTGFVSDYVSSTEVIAVWWRKGLNKYALSFMLPPTKSVSRAVVISQSLVTRSFLTDIYHSSYSETKTTLLGVAGAPSLQMISSSPSKMEMLDAETGSIHDKNKQDEEMAYSKSVPQNGEVLFVKSSGGEKDTSLEIPGYQALENSISCNFVPVNFEKLQADPHIKKAVETFDKVFAETEEKRKSWLICLATKAAGDCKSESDVYSAADDARNSVWSSLLKAKELPVRFYLTKNYLQVALLSPETVVPEFKVVSTIKNDESKKEEPAPTPPKKEPPPPPPLPKFEEVAFEIPERVCVYPRINGQFIAQCDANLVCRYSQGASLSARCSDGRSCQVSDGKVKCQ
jgi:hypothetical protein